MHARTKGKPARIQDAKKPFGRHNYLSHSYDLHSLSPQSLKVLFFICFHFTFFDYFEFIAMSLRA